MPRIVAPISFRSVSSSVLLAACLTGCVVVGPPPYDEYTLARSAVHAAQDVDSAQFAPSFWAKAEENFRLGEKAWSDNDNDNAKKYFRLAQSFAEKAENTTRLKKFQTGDALP